jgi:hypothetical protein
VFHLIVESGAHFFELLLPQEVGDRFGRRFHGLRADVGNRSDPEVDDLVRVVKHQPQFDFVMFELAFRNVNRRALHGPCSLRNLRLECAGHSGQFFPRAFQIVFANGILEVGAEAFANGRQPTLGEVVHDVFGDGQALLVGRLRQRKPLGPQNDGEKQQEISKRAHGDLQRFD